MKKPKRKSTMIELVQELEKRNTEGLYDEIIQEAKDGEYHDFKNDKYVCGKVALCEKLFKFPKLEDIRKQVVEGDYDESPDDEDKRQMISDLSRDPRGKDFITALGLDKHKKD